MFQDNVKKDISMTSDVLKMVEAKLNECGTSMSDLKNNMHELHAAYALLNNQANQVDFGSSPSTSTSCASSLSSSSPGMSLLSSIISRTSSSASLATQCFDQLDSLTDSDSYSSYVIIPSDSEEETAKPQCLYAGDSGVFSGDEDASRSSSESEGRGEVKVEGEGEGEDILLRIDPLNDKRLNEKCAELIRMLMRESHTVPIKESSVRRIF